jgi:succinyl-diaminopimelate desuccinylase
MGFSPDAEFPLIFGEKGVYKSTFSAPVNETSALYIVDISGGEAVNMVCPSVTVILGGPKAKLDAASTAFKAFAGEAHGAACTSQRTKDVLILTVNGKAAHASQPQLGINAVSVAMEFLGRILDDEPFVKGYNKVIGKELDGSSAGIACEDEYGALTLNNGIISMSSGTIYSTIDIRYPITIDFDEKLDILTSTLAENGLTNITDSIDPPLYVAPDTDWILALEETYRKVSGDLVTKPKTIGGGTYARIFSNLVAYGVEFPGRYCNIHMPDEFMDIDEMMTALEIYVEALIRLLEL